MNEKAIELLEKARGYVGRDIAGTANIYIDQALAELAELEAEKETTHQNVNSLWKQIAALQKEIKQFETDKKRLEEMLVLQQEVGGWANKTFGKTQTVVGVINHLIKEVCELRDSDEPNEAADCLLLLFQHAHECGYDLFEEAKKKHEINLKRKWGKPDKHGVIEHIDQALKER